MAATGKKIIHAPEGADCRSWADETYFLPQ
jgi:hypothetical protein